MPKLSPPSAEIASFDERQFYLEEFRGRTLLLALAANAIDPAGAQDLAALARSLILNDTKLVVLLAAGAGEDVEALRLSLRRRLQRLIVEDDTMPLFARAGKHQRRFVGLDADAFDSAAGTSALLAQVWSVLRQGPLFVGIGGHRDPLAAVRFATRLAARLRVQKLVVMQPEGGLVGSDDKRISFMDEPTLAALLTMGEAEWTGLGARRETLALLREALLGGVASANLCSPREAARELFTYEGSGTLFTLQDYCRVERLGIDDFEEAERLIERGYRDGMLKPRSQEEIATLLTQSYGATIGEHHLAGICALISAPYESERAGEIVGLYTITRFKGEGVGVRLVQKVLADAREQGLRYVFATTTAERAQSFFERNGFRRVEHDQVPAAKWQGYDSARKQQAVVLRSDLET